MKCGNCTNQTSRKGETNKKEEEEEGGKRRTTLTLKTGPAAKATCGVRWMDKRVSISVEHAHKAVLIMERTITLEKVKRSNILSQGTWTADCQIDDDK